MIIEIAIGIALGIILAVLIISAVNLLLAGTVLALAYTFVFIQNHLLLMIYLAIAAIGLGFLI